MKHIFLTILALLVTAPAFANHQQAIDIKVNGMVCDFCAQSVWKVFDDYEQVEDVKIDLDSGLVTVLLKPDQALDDDALNKGIDYAGYDLVSISRRAVPHG